MIFTTAAVVVALLYLMAACLKVYIELYRFAEKYKQKSSQIKS